MDVNFEFGNKKIVDAEWDVSSNAEPILVEAFEELPNGELRSLTDKELYQIDSNYWDYVGDSVFELRHLL